MFCNNVFPEQFINCWGGKGLCLNCDVNFGNWNGGKSILVVSENKKECCVCFEEEIHVTLPKCSHELCINCMKKIYFSYTNYNIKYTNNHMVDDDNKDEIDEDEIYKYENYDEDEDDKEDDEENLILSKCPLCRKK